MLRAQLEFEVAALEDENSTWTSGKPLADFVSGLGLILGGNATF